MQSLINDYFSSNSEPFFPPHKVKLSHTHTHTHTVDTDGSLILCSSVVIAE